MFSIAIFTIVTAFTLQDCWSSKGQPAPPVLIAHAGGGIGGQTYTNSLEALNLNYQKGFRFFEIDLSWTHDGKLVAIHDWEDDFRRRFHASDVVGIPTRDEFQKLEPVNGLSQMTLDQVLEWAEEKGDAYIVTDVKERNLSALKQISQKESKYTRHVIPQTYGYSEYKKVEEMGYIRIILTLYRMKINPNELMAFCLNHSPYAVTMHWNLAKLGLARFLRPCGVFIYAHTVNDLGLFTDLKRLGVNGIYTDTLDFSGLG